MSFVNGVNLLPSTGEFTYDTIAHNGQRVTESVMAPINAYANQAGHRTDLDLALDQLQADFPGCATVALVVAWFGNSEDVTACQIYPSTTYIGGGFEIWTGSTWATDAWNCSGLTQLSPGLIPIPTIGSSFVYGGTPSDQSIVRCIQDLKTRGLRVVFYPFILMTSADFPWRGRISYQTADVSSGAATAVANFLGSAAPGDFTRDATHLTVSYSGSPTDYTYRRMILHYANLCVIAGGVDLFLLGSELRGLETIRGPAWTNAGTVDGSGHAVWDYPFVTGLVQLSDDVRGVFDGAGLTKDLSGLHNLISYAADWSAWTGYSHASSNPPSPNGQWPHLDHLWSHPNIDLVCYDNYLPLSDWTTGTGGLDVANWSAARPTSWPPTNPTSTGLGLSGTPTLYSKDYLKANIEGGERFHWFYFDSNNLGRELDPNGTDLRVSLAEGDRLTQARNRYYPGQDILAQKNLRWWWNNAHQALYDNGDGTGESPKGPATGWVANSKSIAFTEYGYPSCDRSTNQPNVFFDPKSTESFTPYWSVWEPADGGGFLPRADQNLQLMALQAVYEYWFTDAPSNNETVLGVVMVEPAFCSVWNWDARPFPFFPAMTSVWGDVGNWRAGDWLNGKGPYITPPVPDSAPPPGSWPTFPTFAGLGWSVHYRPQFTTGVAEHVSGRASRVARLSIPVWEIEITFDSCAWMRPTSSYRPSWASSRSNMGRRRPSPFRRPQRSAWALR